MKQIAKALASTAGILVLAGCSNAPYRTAAAPEYQSYDYVGPTEAPNALYGGSYEAPYDVAPAPMYGEQYESPYDVAPNAPDCSITNKHPTGASC